jgi:hypothetical protein
MFTAFRSLVLRSFTLYGVWWTELFAAPTGIVSAGDRTQELRTCLEPALYRRRPFYLFNEENRVPLALRTVLQSSDMGVTAGPPTRKQLTSALISMTIGVTMG